VAPVPGPVVGSANGCPIPVDAHSFNHNRVGRRLTDTREPTARCWRCRQILATRGTIGLEVVLDDLAWRVALPAAADEKKGQWEGPENPHSPTKLCTASSGACTCGSPLLRVGARDSFGSNSTAPMLYSIEGACAEVGAASASAMKNHTGTTRAQRLTAETADTFRLLR
jgi:hypothetical protein